MGKQKDNFEWIKPEAILDVKLYSEEGKFEINHLQ